jgi:hypothetical protein
MKSIHGIYYKGELLYIAEKVIPLEPQNKQDLYYKTLKDAKNSGLEIIDFEMSKEVTED